MQLDLGEEVLRGYGHTVSDGLFAALDFQLWAVAVDYLWGPEVTDVDSSFTIFASALRHMDSQP